MKLGRRVASAESAVVIATGGARGISVGTEKLLVTRWAPVWNADVDPTVAGEAAGAIPRARARHLDVMDPQPCRSLTDEVPAALQTELVSAAALRGSLPTAELDDIARPRTFTTLRIGGGRTAVRCWVAPTWDVTVARGPEFAQTAARTMIDDRVLTSIDLAGRRDYLDRTDRHARDRSVSSRSGQVSQ
ncbi:hypothetical protein QMK17_04835 [Rhodococcus sp. G-MC3]|uniref:hypothetical protein n=1 Tax=Rhodococcus sp. G-MC3 TaxID=3046209 RepID=UPI0024BB9634|nr:hypothetical protein [Rhodococcus sp. G-MC3]MDJ0392652.1 hypothetical protein [Rhodococcus sp. G-MC3]